MSYYIGLMSGTSMDAVDAALVDFSHSQHPRLVAHHSHPIPPDIREPLQHAISHTTQDIRTLGKLDVQLGRLFAEATLTLLSKSEAQSSEVTAIGSHGQTIFHAPEHQVPFTLQIADPSSIAEHTGITTVADFRRRDIAAGGQGAPLVPAFHQQAFRSTEVNRIILNIGGIANITILPASGDHPVSGFDTGPGNTLMDCWAARHLGTQYDGNGDWAQGGDINDELLKAWLEDPYFTLPPPKSTGREYFNLEWSNTFRVDDSARNIQATFCKLTVETIARAIERHTKDCHEIYTCGGGTHNTHLMMCLRERLSPLKLRTTDDLGIPPDWVEAVAFAWLAKQTLERKPGNLPLATGAKHPAILGGIYLSGN